MLHRHVLAPLGLATGLVIALVVLGAPVAAQQSPGTVPVVPTLGAATVFTDEDVLARVNGRPIPAVSLDNVMRQLDQDETAPDRAAILDELIDMEVLAQAAETEGLDRRPDIASALMLQYTQTLANAWLAEQNAGLSIGEDELAAEYERQVAGLRQDEYRAAHILLESEADAREVLAALDAGEAFETLAAERSIDSNGASGGALGWLGAAAMLPEMAEAIADMAPGETRAEPVASDYGWHVLRLEETRGAALPDYEALKPALEGLLVRRALAERVSALRDRAVVRRLDAPVSTDDEADGQEAAEAITD